MAYRRTDDVQARLDDKRKRILEAARALVSEGGWPEAQVSHVAAVAGLATGTVYRYFPSKAALVGLVDLLRDDHADTRLVDTQWQTPHLASLGVVEIPRSDYLGRLHAALALPLPSAFRPDTPEV